MEYSRTEIRTGLMVVLAALVAAGAIFIVGDFRNFFTPKMKIFVEFDRSHGLKEFAEVRYAGVKVGEVEAIRLTKGSPPRVELETEVRRDAGIKKGSEARIKTLGFLGERYVEIEPPEKGGALLPDNARLVGRSSAQLEDIGIILGDLSEQIGETRKNLDAILGDKTFQADLKASVRRASELTDELKGILAENRPAIRATLGHARSASREMDTILTKHRDQLSATITDLASLADKMDGAADDLDALASKSRGLIDRNESQIDGTITDLRTTAKNMRDLSSDLKRNPHKLIRIFPNIFRRKPKEEVAAPPEQAAVPAASPAAPAGAP
jgi:phospholipid/cholesterol/gamma-HCH transport system substrate-binding protein